MNELHTILRSYETLKQSGKNGALATIMKVRGSTYRRPGARMLIDDAGKTIGTVSGGCLEADVAEKAKKVIAAGQAQTVVYDLTAEGDAVWGLNQGCNGVVHLLIEPIGVLGSTDHLDFIQTCVNKKATGIMATVFRVDGELKATVGSRVLLQDDGAIQETVKNPTLVAALVEDCREALATGQGKVKEYRLTEGIAEVSIEVIQPPIPLFLFGAGYDVIPVARFAKELGWEVTVVDHRPAFASKERFPTADTLIHARPEEVSSKIALDNRSVAVIMTHNFSYDLELLKALLPSPARYVGLLGPKMRAERLLNQLRKAGSFPTEQQLARLFTPVGLDIGAESPEEIAIAILSEIQAVLKNRSAGFLKNSTRPIHDSP
ncbi:MAG TPA: XdhC/CoxI family protein [Bacteroidota bacterium]|nr:XdhC/CoxI family protein [Bacteroidota bacterium]